MVARRSSRTSKPSRTWRSSRVSASSWFRSLGTVEEPGTALVTIGGAVGAPGVYEIALGTLVSGVVTAAGGLTGDVSAFLVGGYFGTWIRASTGWDLALTHNDLRAARSTFGCGVIYALPASACGIVETGAGRPLPRRRDRRTVRTLRLRARLDRRLAGLDRGRQEPAIRDRTDRALDPPNRRPRRVPPPRRRDPVRRDRPRRVLRPPRTTQPREAAANRHATNPSSPSPTRTIESGAGDDPADCRSTSSPATPMACAPNCSPNGSRSTTGATPSSIRKPSHLRSSNTPGGP